MRSSGIVLGAWLLMAWPCLPGWAGQTPAPAKGSGLAVLALDGSRSMEGFQRAGSLGRVARAFRESATAAGLDYKTNVFSSSSPTSAPDWLDYQDQHQDGAQFKGVYTRLPEAFESADKQANFIFFLTDNLDNQGAAGLRLVKRFRDADVAAVLALPMSLPFAGEVFENDLGRCPSDSLERLLRWAKGPPGGRVFDYQGSRGLIGYLVARDSWDLRQRQALVRSTTGLLRELANQAVFHLGQTGQFPLLPLKCFQDGLRGPEGELRPFDPAPVDLSAGAWVELRPLRLVLPELLPGVSVRPRDPKGDRNQVVELRAPPRVWMKPPAPEAAPWLRGGRDCQCQMLPPSAGDHLDTMRLSIRLSPLEREPVGLLDGGRFLHLALGNASRLSLILELHSQLHASALETSPLIREALLTSNPCELTKVAFPLGTDHILMLAPEGEKRLRLHQTWRVELEGGHPFRGPDLVWFLFVWSAAGLLALLAGCLFWLRLTPRRFEYAAGGSRREPNWGRATKLLRLKPGRRSEPLKEPQGRELGRLRVSGLGLGQQFQPAEGVRPAQGCGGPIRIGKRTRLELWLPGEATPETSMDQNHAHRTVHLWIKKL